MKTSIAAALLALSLAGCADSNYASSYSGDDAATMMLLGGTAFLNGYNAGRQPMPMITTSCTPAGCLSF